MEIKGYLWPLLVSSWEGCKCTRPRPGFAWACTSGALGSQPCGPWWPFWLLHLGFPCNQ